VLRILLIQKNNIGDLVLATPLICELRRRFPGARIDALVNSYNASVLDGNPHVDQVHVYTKRKHLERGQSALASYAATLRLVLTLRRFAYDYVFLLNGCTAPRNVRLARSLGAGHIVGLMNGIFHHITTRRDDAYVDHAMVTMHVAARSLSLLSAAFSFVYETDWTPERFPCQVFADPHLRQRWLDNLELRGLQIGRPLCALQISARRVNQRWPAQRFIELARLLHSSLGAQILLFWSPGDTDALTHPGDDKSAREIEQACSDLPIFPCATATLPELIAGLSLCDLAVTSDGGAMHLAAACNCRVVALFGDADPVIWHPWSSSYRIVRSTSTDVSDIGVTDIYQTVAEFLTHARTAGRAGMAPHGSPRHIDRSQSVPHAEEREASMNLLYPYPRSEGRS
jgi:heptosyltransferase III